MKTMENSSIQIKKKKKKQTTKLLPKNVFEIVGNQGELVERVQPKDKNEKKTKKENESKVTFSERTTKRRRREWDALNYEPYDITRGREYEKSLQKVATRGIVQLFNTVRKQQQQSTSSGKKDKKKNGINKGEFLDMLKNIDSDETSYKVLKKNASMEESSTTTKKPARWNVLQDDLMASVKDDDDNDDDDDEEEED